MRQTYVSGEKLSLDYAGDTVPVIVHRFDPWIQRSPACRALKKNAPFGIVVVWLEISSPA